MYKKLIRKYYHLGVPYPSCGTGWYSLLENSFKELDNIIYSNNIPRFILKIRYWFLMKTNLGRYICNHYSIYPFYFHQIKEKFGGLRLYTSYTSDKIESIITHAEDLSYYTCEFCGSTENVGQTKGWIYTICKSCFDKGEVNMKEWNANF